MPKKLRIENQVFTRLIVIRSIGIGLSGKSLWECRCVCGTIKSVIGADLMSGKTQSCGCLKNELVSQIQATHGMSRTRFYCIWNNLKKRCLNSNNPAYIDYGGRGITVCERWLKFENFRDDMWESYQNHVVEFGEKNTSIDRIKSDGNYCPENCRWATRREQNRNKRNSSKTENYDAHLKRKVVYLLS